MSYIQSDHHLHNRMGKVVIERQEHQSLPGIDETFRDDCKQGEEVSRHFGQLLTLVPVMPVSSGFILSFEYGVGPFSQLHDDVLASPDFCTTLHRLLTYKGMQPATSGAISC